MDSLQTQPDSSTSMEENKSTVSDGGNDVLIIEGKTFQDTQDNLQIQPDSSTSIEKMNVSESDREDDVIIIEEREFEEDVVKIHIPTKNLVKRIAKAIILSPKGFASVEDIEALFPKRLHYKDRLKKLILNTLRNNSDVFIPHVVSDGDSFKSGFWILHPLSAAQFINDNILEESTLNKKETNCHTQHRDIFLLDEKLDKSHVVIKHLPALDFWASKMESITMVLPPANVVSTMKNYGITFEMIWRGWSYSDKVQECKISKLEKVIQNANGSLMPNTSQINQRKHLMKIKSASTIESFSKAQSKSQSKRPRLSDSGSEADSSDNEALASDSIVHQEHNYVASKDSAGSKNLIENLRKIVQKMDKESNKKSVKNIKNSAKRASSVNAQEEEEVFLGFDYELWSGYWRGWEKSLSKNAERLREIIRTQEGSRNLEDMLRESSQVVTKFIEALEKFQQHKVESKPNPGPLDVSTAIKTHLKDLLDLMDGMAEEPPVSYLVLVVMAICASPEMALPVDDICRFIQQHFPFHGRRGHSLEPLVETLLVLGAPSTFILQKRRSTTNIWRVDPTRACGLLELALCSARLKMKEKPTKDILEKNTQENKVVSCPSVNDVKPFHQSVIVDAKTLKPFNKTTHINEGKSSNIHRGQLNEESCYSTKENIHKKPVKGNLALHGKLENQNTKNITLDKNKSFKSNAEPSLIYSAPEINETNLSNNSANKISSSSSTCTNSKVATSKYSEKILDENSVIVRKGSFVDQEDSHQCSVINKNISSPEKMNGLRSPLEYCHISEELEIVDIDPCLQVKESFSIEDDDVIVIDEEEQPAAHVRDEQLFNSEQQSISKTEINRTFSCLFLLSCENIDPNNKQFPCYICHKFYPSNDILNIHLAQSHFGEDNVHRTTPLCANRKWKSKCIKGAKNVLTIPHENIFPPEGMDSSKITNHGFIHFPPLLHPKTVPRYNCSSCNAVYHEKKALHLHIRVYHENASISPITPSKQFSTPEGTQYFYCPECSGCFHTEKALEVHICVPFSRAQSSST